MTEQDRFDDLVKTLKHDFQGEFRAHAADMLGKLGDPRAVPVLIEAMEDKCVIVPDRAAAALGQLKDLRAAPVLIAALEDIHTRYHAAHALMNIGLSRIEKEYRISRKDIVTCVLECDGKVGGDNLDQAIRLVPHIIENFGDGSERIRKNAIRIFRNISRDACFGDRSSELEKMISEGLQLLRKKMKGRKIWFNPEKKMVELRMEIEAMKNELAPRRDIMLDDVPRPPKRGTTYRAMDVRRVSHT